MEKDISIRSSLLKELEKQMTKPGFDAWMRELEICEIDEALHIAYLGVPDIPGRNVPQIVSVLQDRYKTLLESSLEKVMHERYRVVVKEMAEYDRMPPASKREVMKNAMDFSSQNPPARAMIFARSILLIRLLSVKGTALPMLRLLQWPVHRQKRTILCTSTVHREWERPICFRPLATTLSLRSRNFACYTCQRKILPTS